MTVKEKEQFFALYWGQKIFKVKVLNHLSLVNDYLKMEVKDGYLELKSLSNITDEDAIEIAKMAHQLDANFKVIRPSGNHFLIHLEYTNSRQTYHVSINEYGCINTNLRFPEDEYFTAECYKINIGEINITSRKPVPYIAIVDYLRSKGYALPYLNYSLDYLVKENVIKIV